MNAKQAQQAIADKLGFPIECVPLPTQNERRDMWEIATEGGSVVHADVDGKGRVWIAQTFRHHFDGCPSPAEVCAAKLKVTDWNKAEPMPHPGQGQPIWDLVIQAMQERHAQGCAKYGVPLQAFNGRRPWADLLQELMDACAYVMQAIVEADAKDARIAQLEADLAQARKECADWQGMYEVAARRADDAEAQARKLAPVGPIKEKAPWRK